MPPQQGLGADQEAGPGRARQPLAETGEQEAIGRLPAGMLDLALEDAQLVAQDQELEVEIRIWATSIEEGLEEQPEGRVEERQEHGEPSWHVVSDPATGRLPDRRPPFS